MISQRVGKKNSLKKLCTFNDCPGKCIRSLGVDRKFVKLNECLS